MHRLFLVLSLPLKWAVGSPLGDAWFQCTVNDQQTLTNSTIRRVDATVASLEVCAALASSHQWPELFCYGGDAAEDDAQEGQTCTLWPIEAVAVGDVVRAPSAGNATCMTMIPESRLYAPVPRCPKPFYMTSFGCIFVDKSLQDWANSRLSCQALGGDLFIAHDVEDFNSMAAHMLKYYGYTYNEIWAGLLHIGGSWQWLSGRPLDQQECGQCSDNGGDCARFDRNSRYKANDMQCTAKYGLLCRRRHV